MIKDLWFAFPRNLEERVQALLEYADPRPLKAFHLYKTCVRSESYTASFEKFQRVLSEFFTPPQAQRKKSDLDRLLMRPLEAHDFAQFHLTFHSAAVNNLALQDLASWAFNLMRVGLKIKSVILNQDLVYKSLYRLVHPLTHEKGENISFREFYESWSATVRKQYGSSYEQDLQHILNELKWLETQQHEAEEAASFNNNGRILIYLTQTEIYWVQDVLQAVQKDTAIPKFPLSRGPAKSKLCDLERTARLYKIVQTTQLPELLLHKKKIKTTLIHQCEELLQTCDRGIAS